MRKQREVESRADLLGGPEGVSDEVPTPSRVVAGKGGVLDGPDSRCHTRPVLDVAVIEDASAAEATLEPIRARLLAELGEPASAATLAARIGMPRQKVNYHLRELERHGLVELVDERRKGNVMERVMRATASSYVISPAVLAPIAPDPERAPDRLSARWLLALASKLVRDIGSLLVGSAREGKRVSTYALDGEVRFGSAAKRAAFAEELTSAVTSLVSKYHDDQAEGGRSFRIVVAVHPQVKDAAAADPVIPAKED